LQHLLILEKSCSGQSRYALVSFYFTALHKKYTAAIGGAVLAYIREILNKIIER